MGQMMSWEEIRQHHPETFVLLDHCKEQREGKNMIRIIGGEVVFTTSNGKTIYDEYCKRGQPADMTFGHTHWEKLEMEEVPFLGIRPAHD